MTEDFYKFPVKLEFIARFLFILLYAIFHGSCSVRLWMKLRTELRGLFLFISLLGSFIYLCVIIYILLSEERKVAYS